MATDIVIPKLGFSMSEGTLVEWLVKDNDRVEQGLPLYLLEAEKSTQEIEAPESGTVRIKAEAGAELPVGTVIGTSPRTPKGLGYPACVSSMGLL